MRELNRPPDIDDDPKATEMVRVWIAKDDLHVSMLLGMWADALGTDVDERDAWGELLADLTRHIANGLHQSHGWDETECIRDIADAYDRQIHESDVEVEGGYPGDSH
jgi:predicted secreted Zn-dependent protease